MGSSSTDGLWRSFLSLGSAEDRTNLPMLDALKAAKAAEEAAKEAEHAKDEQLKLMSAMLKAAEEELKTRSNQLELTNAMLQATEGELKTQSEQLEITTQMLRKAEEEIRERDREMTVLRRELAGTRESLANATTRCTAERSSTSARVHDSQLGVGALGTEAWHVNPAARSGDVATDRNGKRLNEPRSSRSAGNSGNVTPDARGEVDRSKGGA